MDSTQGKGGVSRKVDTVLGACIAACLAVMAVLVFGNVVLRYAFNSGITWSEEMSRYFFVFMIFLGSVSAAMLGKHISVDLLVERLAPGGRRSVLVLGHLATIAVLLMLIIGCWQLAWINANSKGPVTGFPLWLLFAGCIGMAAGMIAASVRDLRHALAGRPAVARKHADD